jgi:hypothetical protein
MIGEKLELATRERKIRAALPRVSLRIKLGCVTYEGIETDKKG